MDQREPQSAEPAGRVIPLGRTQNPPPKDDEPLHRDIRDLGRILGDTVREQEGTEAYELVEAIRVASVAFHRGNEHERQELLKHVGAPVARRDADHRARVQLFLAPRQHGGGPPPSPAHPPPRAPR